MFLFCLLDETSLVVSWIAKIGGGGLPWLSRVVVPGGSRPGASDPEIDRLVNRHRKLRLGIVLSFSAEDILVGRIWECVCHASFITSSGFGTGWSVN